MGKSRVPIRASNRIRIKKERVEEECFKQENDKVKYDIPVHKLPMKGKKKRRRKVCSRVRRHGEKNKKILQGSEYPGTYLTGFSCKYCGYHFTSFDGFRRHTSSHEKRWLHRTLQTKWRRKRKWQCSPYLHMPMATKRQEIGIKKEMEDLVQNNMTDDNSSHQRSITDYCPRLKGNSSLETHKTDCVRESVLQQHEPIIHNQVKIFKSQCQKKYWKVKETLYDTFSLFKWNNKFTCSSCSMYGFRNMNDVLQHEEAFKHCVFCETSFVQNNHDTDVMKHLHVDEREKVAKSMLTELNFAPSCNKDSYHEPLGCKVTYCCFCSCWFTEVGYDDHLKSSDHTQKRRSTRGKRFSADCDKEISHTKSQIMQNKTDSVNRAGKGGCVPSRLKKVHYTVPTMKSGCKQAKEQIYACNICNKVCKSVCFLNWHRESHSPHQYFQCYNCNSVLLNKKTLVLHEVKFQHCSYCWQRFESEVELLNHRKQIVAEGLMVDFPHSSVTASQGKNSTADSPTNLLQLISNTFQHENLANPHILSHNSQGTEVGIVRVENMSVENTSTTKNLKLDLVFPVALLKTSSTSPDTCHVEVVPLENAKSSMESKTCVKSGESSNIGTVGGLSSIPNADLMEKTVNTESSCSESWNASALLSNLSNQALQELVMSQCNKQYKTDFRPVTAQALGHSYDTRKLMNLKLSPALKNKKALQLVHQQSKSIKDKRPAYPYECNNCGQSFFDKKQLVEHEVQARHCAYCNVSFQEIQHLINHRVTKHTFWSVTKKTNATQ